MRLLFPIARIMFSLIFITAAPRHFSNEGIGHAVSLGVPFAHLLVPLSGIMAIVGGAIIPVAQGAMADRMGIHHAFVLPVICYLYILYFALWGSKPNSERHGLQMQRS